jgi:hypothetical protein
MSLLKYVTIVNQNGESSKSTKRKTTDHQQEKIKESDQNPLTQFLFLFYIPFCWLHLEAMAYRLAILVKKFLFDSFRILLFF